MPGRIDRVELSLWIYDEFAGHRTVKFVVDDPEFTVHVYRVWQAHSERLLAEARERGGDWGMIG